MSRIDDPERPKSGSRKDELRFVVCGPEDDGKAALLERLMDDSGAIPVDGSREEPEYWIAGDVVCRRFATEEGRFVAIDVPGGEGYTRNLVAGASRAELAVVRVGAREGVRRRTRRDAYIVSLMGIRRAIVAVDSMDLVDFDEGAFSAIVDEFRAFADQVGIEKVDAVPVSAPTGGGASWYDGPTLMESLKTVDIALDPGGDARTPETADQFAAHLIWLDTEPMLPERPLPGTFRGRVCGRADNRSDPTASTSTVPVVWRRRPSKRTKSATARSRSTVPCRSRPTRRTHEPACSF